MVSVRANFAKTTTDILIMYYQLNIIVCTAFALKNLCHWQSIKWNFRYSLRKFLTLKQSFSPPIEAKKKKRLKIYNHAKLSTY